MEKFNPNGWVLATDGTASGLVIPRLHAVGWADGIAPDGVEVRVFAWWPDRGSDWAYEVWPRDTDIQTASDPAAATVRTRIRVLDERGFGAYDDDGHKVYTFRHYSNTAVRYTSQWRIEHGGGTYTRICHGCTIEDLIEDVARGHDDGGAK